MSTPYPTSWAGVGGSVATALFQTIIQDALAGGSDWLKVTFAISQGWTRSTFEKVYDYIADASPDDNVGITSDGILDVFEAMLEETTKLEVFVGKEIAQEMFAETIQEALSNAVQYNLGGAVQSILNIWRGSYPLSYDEIDEVITTIEDIDTDLASLLIAQAGSNLPSTQWRMKVGFDRYIEDKLIALRGQLHEIVTRINDMIIWLHERSYTNALRQFDNALNALNDAYERAIGLIDEICERALARLQELKGELMTTKAWWDYTKEHPEDEIIDPSEVYKVSLENKLEADATHETVTQLLNAIDSSLTSLSVDLTNVVNYVRSVVSKCVQIYDNIIWTGQLNVQDIIQKLDEIIQKVSAYRHSVNLQTEVKYPSVPLYWNYRPETYEGEITPPVEEISIEVVEHVRLKDDGVLISGEYIIKGFDESVQLSDEQIVETPAQSEQSESISVGDEVTVEVFEPYELVFTEQWSTGEPPAMEHVFTEEWSE